MFLSEYTMERETEGCIRTAVKRRIFAYNGRFLGIETAVKEWFEGELRGWAWRQRDTDTKEFPTAIEAQAWIEDLHAFDDLDRVQGLGGTQVVAIA